MPISTAMGYLSIHRQSAPESYIKPDNFLRFIDGGLKKTVENVKNMPIQNNRWSTMSMKKGGEVNEANVNTHFDFNETVWQIYAQLGAINTSDISSGTDGSVYEHTITIANELPSFCIEQAKGDRTDTADNLQRIAVERGYGAKSDQFTLKGEDGNVLTTSSLFQMLGIFDTSRLLSDAAAGSSVALSLETVEGLTTADSVNIYDETPQNEVDAIASLNAAAKTITIGTLGNSYAIDDNAKVELQAQTPSYGTAPQHASLFDCMFQFADAIGDTGAAAETNVDNFEITISNNMNVRRGTKRPGASRVDAQRTSAQITFKKVFTTKAEYDQYRRTAKRALKVTITNNTIISATDTNEAKYQLVLNFPDIRYDEFDMPTANDGIYEIEATCEVLYDTSAGYAIQAVMQNAKIGTLYTSTS